MKEKFTYPVGIKVFAFMLIGFCAAVRFGTAENLILPVTLAVGLQAGIVLFLEKKRYTPVLSEIFRRFYTVYNCAGSLRGNGVGRGFDAGLYGYIHGHRLRHSYC